MVENTTHFKLYLVEKFSFSHKFIDLLIKNCACMFLNCEKSRKANSPS